MADRRANGQRTRHKHRNGKTKDIYRSQENFGTKALAIMKEASRIFGIQSCFDDAFIEAKKKSSPGTDEFFSIAWLSMYSRFCKIENGLRQEPQINNFPFRLNRELRCLTVPNRDPNVREVFVKVRDILDEALEIQVPELHYNIFKGLETFPFAGQAEFVEEGFFSTTKEIDVALREFAKGNILLIIYTMTGVNIMDFAEDRFREQKEVLGKSKRVLRIERTVRDDTEIRTILKQYKAKSYGSRPREIMFATEIEDDDAVEFDRVVRGQRSLSLRVDYCRPK